MIFQKLQNFAIKVYVLLRNLFRIIIEHFDSYRFGFDPVLTVEKYKKFNVSRRSSLNKGHLFDTILCGIIFADFVLCCFVEKFFKKWKIYEYWNLELPTFRAVTRAWIGVTPYQRDLLLDIIYPVMFWILYNTFRNKIKHRKYLNIVVKNGNKYSITQNDMNISKKLEEKFLKYWTKLTPRVNFLICYIIFLIFLLYPGSFIGKEIIMPDKHTGGFRNKIYILVLPYYFILVGYLVIWSMYFVLVCFYFKIKQNFMTDQVRILVRASRGMNLRRKRFLLKSFVENMKNLMNLVTEIAIYNSFWSPYMTLYFILYTLVISFAFLIFISSVNFQTSLLMLFSFSYLAFLSKISLDSSHIEDRNVELYFSLKNIYLRFQKQEIKENIGFALKVNSFLSLDRFFQRSSFKLKNGYRINNRLLEFFLTSLIGISLRTYGDTIRKQFFS